MAKKAAAVDFNMSQAIRDVLTENPNVSSREAVNAILAKHPNAKINKNSFSVAFYTGRQKLGISVSGRRGARGRIAGTGVRHAARHSVDLDTLHAAAKFLSTAGSVDSALEAIRQVQAVQLK
jgi:hypothetical protein